MRKTKSGRVAGKVALVSGAAGGIGRASCLALAREGAAVVATDIDGAGAEATAAACRAEGAKALGFAHDVTQEPEWIAIVDKTVAELGGLDILVNNAGVALRTPLLDPDLAAWRKTMDVNLDGVYLGLRAALRVMRTRAEGHGSIINISSIYGFVGSINIAAYGASKGAVRLLTKSAAIECAANGWRARVNSIHPGYIETAMIKSAFARGGEEALAARMRETLAAHPIGRLGQPEDIASGVLYLASDESSFVTGSELVIDGGYTAR